MGVIDLKSFQLAVHPSGSTQREASYVFRQAYIFSSHGLHALTYVSAVCSSLRWQLQSHPFHMSRPISIYGLCPDHLSRKSARHRSMFTSSEPQGLSHGHQGQGAQVNAGRCQRDTRLANLFRSGALPDYDGSQALQYGTVSRRIKRNRLRTRRHNHRSLPVHVSMGQLPQAQGSHQTPYAARSARQHPNFYPYLRRQTSRSQHTRHYPAGSGSLLCDGSRISGLQATVQNHSGNSLLCDSSQVQSQMPPGLLSSSGAGNRNYLRPVSHAHRLLSSQGLSGKTAARKISRCRNQQNPGVPDQQLHAAAADYCQAVSLSLAGRIVFQVDQAKPQNQDVLWNFGKRRQDSNLDCSIRLCHRRNHEKAAQSQGKSLHNPTGLERICIRANRTYSATYRNRLQN